MALPSNGGSYDDSPTCESGHAYTGPVPRSRQSVSTPWSRKPGGRHSHSGKDSGRDRDRACNRPWRRLLASAPRCSLVNRQSGVPLKARRYGARLTKSAERRRAVSQRILTEARRVCGRGSGLGDEYGKGGGAETELHGWEAVMLIQWNLWQDEELQSPSCRRKYQMILPVPTEQLKKGLR